MRIGILGTGRVGKALGEGWTTAGHEVLFGSRDSARANVPAGTAVRTREEAVRASDVVVLAVPFRAVAETLERVGPSAFEGKVLVDVTNPLTADGGWAVGFTTSAAEELARRVPRARVVKAFNTVFEEHMRTGKLDGEPVTLFVAGDDAEAKATVVQLGRDLGFDPVDAGPLRNARFLEPMAMQLMAFLEVGTVRRSVAYRLLRRARSFAWRLIRRAH